MARQAIDIVTQRRIKCGVAEGVKLETVSKDDEQRPKR